MRIQSVNRVKQTVCRNLRDAECLRSFQEFRIDLKEGESPATHIGTNTHMVWIGEDRIFCHPRRVKGLQLSYRYVRLTVDHDIVDLYSIPSPPEGMVRDERFIQLYLRRRSVGFLRP